MLHRSAPRGVSARSSGRLSIRSAASVAALVAGASLLFAGEGQAQTLEEIQRQNAQLAAENARLKQALADAGLAPAAAAPVAPSPAAAPPARVAEDGVGDEVLVGALTVEAVRIKELPKSVSAVTGEELEKFHVNNFRDIVNRIGNVRTSWNNPNTASIFVRGVGWAAGAGVLDPSVGVVVDGVSHGITSISALSNYLDIETVEIVRGPTGTDGYKATNLGRVEIQTRRPTFDFEARAAATFGELNTVIATAAVGGPIIDDVLAYRLTFNRETADGPFKNLNDSHYTWRNTDRTNVRAQLLWTPTPRLEALFSLDYTPTGREICENCFAFPVQTPAQYDWINPATGSRGLVDLANDNFGKIQRRWFLQKGDYTVADYYAHEINTVGEYPNTYETRGATANIAYALTETATLRSITGWRDYEFSQGAGSHTPFEWLRAPRGTQTAFEQWTQELRLDAKLSDSLTYRGGLYYFRGRFPNYSQTERYGSDGGAWYATAAQYALLDPVNPALPNATDPAGRALLLNSVNGLITQRSERYENDSYAAYSNLVWDATDRLTLSAGVRLSREERQSEAESGILSNGYGAELNPAAINNVTLNGFSSNAAGALTGTNSASQLALADFVAQKYFGVATYGGLTAAQRAQVGAAKSIRAARLGALYQLSQAEDYSATLPTLEAGLSYRLNDDHTLHLSYKHGEKPGISQIVGATAAGGKSVPAKKETTDAYEIGLKSFVLDRDLSVSATAFLQDIEDYIQPGFVYDEVQTQLNNDGKPAYLSALGNVPKVRTKGVELDVAYFGLLYTTVRLSGAYTDARYRDFKFAANPGELGGANPAGPYYDASGRTLAGAPKWSGNLFVDFSYPLDDGRAFHANLNHNFQSGYYPDITLSRYTKTDAWGVTDVSLGLSLNEGRFDVRVIAKNLFDVDTGLAPSWNQWKPGIPRWVGLTVTATLD